jgi:hypothetical protein
MPSLLLTSFDKSNRHNTARAPSELVRPALLAAETRAANR